MSEKNKAILIVNLIILILAASFLSQGIKQHSKTIDGIITTEEKDIDATIFALRELSFDPYKTRLRNLIATSTDIVDAFAKRQSP